MSASDSDAEIDPDHESDSSLSPPPQKKKKLNSGKAAKSAPTGRASAHPGRRRLHRRYLRKPVPIMLMMRTGLGRFFLSRFVGHYGRFRRRGRAAWSCTRIWASSTQTIGSPIHSLRARPIGFGVNGVTMESNGLIASVSCSAQTRQGFAVWR